ncbi:RloB domain-containing protein [Bradymonadaceae bacterium TMQ3]|uniref:RloB domain-containing protein n=1 Tax=Lujinxingia sediminis TaxID=2480984 RepID=A0ABY0CMS5_9DELT|nr:RloB family protein [Lujinxingia sediminis]RDV36260.1 RloB domain-containing protein [Bradymonadaceae bacterium TMQ3]RVU40726.1 RloB domain-containing protein [Lujinxingia sediminis]TXC67849.1 RloB domain-containing protein [Bradymonadales bacterium TMQ1]
MGKQKPRGSSTTRRRSARRQSLERLLILCEGDKTEPDYFERLRREYRLPSADIKIIPDAGGGAAKSIVKEARRLQKNNQKEHRKTGEPLYDEIWCIFDSEDPHHNPGIYDAIKQANTHGFHIGLSVPCFEYWILLHYTSDQRPYRNCTQVLNRLQAVAPAYGKANIDFDALKPSLRDAIQRARTGLKSLDIDETSPCCAADLQANPSTRAHLLTEKLIKLGEDFTPY